MSPLLGNRSGQIQRDLSSSQGRVWRFVGGVLLGSLLSAPSASAAEGAAAWAARLDRSVTPQPLTIAAFSRHEQTAAWLQAVALPEQVAGGVRSLSRERFNAFVYSLLLNRQQLSAVGKTADPEAAPAAAARLVLALTGADLAVDLGTIARAPTDGVHQWTLWSSGSNGVQAVYAAPRRHTTTMTKSELAEFLHEAFGYDGTVLAHEGELVLARLPSSDWPLGTAALVLSDSAEALRIDAGNRQPGSYLLRLLQTDGDLAVMKVLATPELSPIAPGTKLQQERRGQ